jgi:hypothetical protein
MQRLLRIILRCLGCLILFFVVVGVVDINLVSNLPDQGFSSSQMTLREEAIRVFLFAILGLVLVVWAGDIVRILSRPWSQKSN